MIVTMMKNEGPYIVEWVAHHLAVGFDRFLVFTNDCDDQTDRILDRLDEMRIVLHRPNPKMIFRHLGAWNVAGFRYARTFNQFKDSNWIFAIDVDEFLEIGYGNNSLGDLFQRAPDFDLMSISVIGYNSSGIKHIGDGAIQSKFLKCRHDFSGDGSSENGKGCSVKTLMRNNIEGAMFRNHRPKIDNFSKTDMIWLDGAGNPMPEEFTDNKINGYAGSNSTSLAHINHHSLRSMEAYLVKADRGDVVDDRRMGLSGEQLEVALNYWHVRNTKLDAENRTPAQPSNYAKAYSEIMADPVIKELHEESLEIHRQKVNHIIKTKNGEQLARGIGFFD